MSTYAVSDQIANRATHSVPIGVCEENSSGNPTLENGTLTFIETNGSIFSMTCQHVIDNYRVICKGEQSKLYTLRTLSNGPSNVRDDFRQPGEDLSGKKPDVCIIKFSRQLMNQIGKKALQIDTMTEPPTDIEFVYAAGFPTKLKHTCQDKLGRNKLILPHANVLAEIDYTPGFRFAMCCKNNKIVDSSFDVSGMSGGPIYWSKGEEFGILALVYEGNIWDDRQTITIFGEAATPNMISSWVTELF